MKSRFFIIDFIGYHLEQMPSGVYCVTATDPNKKDPLKECTDHYFNTLESAYNFILEKAEIKGVSL